MRFLQIKHPCHKIYSHSDIVSIFTDSIAQNIMLEAYIKSMFEKCKFHELTLWFSIPFLWCTCGGILQTVWDEKNSEVVRIIASGMEINFGKFSRLARFMSSVKYWKLKVVKIENLVMCRVDFKWKFLWNLSYNFGMFELNLCWPSLVERQLEEFYNEY